MTADREKFEIYAANQGLRDFERNEFDDYRNPFTQQPWCFWRASRDALAQSPAEGDGDERAAFEAWYRQDLLDAAVHERPDARPYRAWRAALASKAQPKGTCDDCISDESDRVRLEMAKLLDGVANAVRGTPPTLTKWSWHDLPERVAAAMAAIEVLQKAAANLAADTAQAPAPAQRASDYPLMPASTVKRIDEAADVLSRLLAGIKVDANEHERALSRLRAVQACASVQAPAVGAEVARNDALEAAAKLCDAERAEFLQRAGDNNGRESDFAFGSVNSAERLAAAIRALASQPPVQHKEGQP